MSVEDQDWAFLCRSYRLKHGLKQEAMAQDFNVDQTTISRWENGQREPSDFVKKMILSDFGSAMGVLPALHLPILLERNAAAMALWTRAGILLGVSPPWREEMLSFGNVDEPVGKHVEQIHNTNGFADRHLGFLNRYGFFEGRVLLATLRFAPFVNPKRAAIGGTSSLTSIPVVIPSGERCQLAIAGHDPLADPPDQEEMTAVIWSDDGGVRTVSNLDAELSSTDGA